MLHYGIEFWGHIEKQTKATDAYMYEALRRLFDIPKATPHRALSSEYALPPTEIQWAYLRRRLGERRKRHDPLKGTPWKEMKTEDREAGSPMPWKVKSRNQPERPRRGETKEWKEIEKMGNKEIAIFTDGSMSKGKVGYGIAAYTKESLEQGGAEWEQAGSMGDKNILDAEVWAIIQAMRATEKEYRVIKIYTDSVSARDWIVEPKKEGALAYMWEEMCEATKPKRDIEIAWVKGHRGNKGNERADALAKKGGPMDDPWKGKSHAARTHEISEKRNETWRKWFDEKEHYYKRRPRRKLKHLRGLTRADTIAVFRIRSDKGWGRTAIGKEDDREECGCGAKMSTDHVMQCRIWEEGRPEGNIQHDKNTWNTARWAKKHNYFEIPPKYYPVRWVNLRCGNIDRRKPQICYVCKTSYPSEEAMRNHARRDHKGNKEVRWRESRSEKFGTDTGTKCPTCGKEYTSQRSMRQHRKTAHGATLGSQVCAGCDKRFPTKEKLREHQRTNCEGGRS